MRNSVTFCLVWLCIIAGVSASSLRHLSRSRMAAPGLQMPGTPEASAPEAKNKVVVHVVTETVDYRVPNAPPKPPGASTADNLAAPATIQAFQAAPLLNVASVPKQTQVITPAATLTTPTYVAPLLAPIQQGELGSYPVATKPDVRIVDPCSAAENNCMQPRTPGDFVEEQLDNVKRAIAKKSGQIRADEEWVRDVKLAIRKYKKKMELVKKNADEIRDNIKRLFGMKSKYEAMLVKYRLGDDIRGQVESSEESSKAEHSLESSNPESSAPVSESSATSQESSKPQQQASEQSQQQQQSSQQQQQQSQSQQPTQQASL